MRVREGDIAFKVVEKGTRKGSNWIIYKRYNDPQNLPPLLKKNFFPSYHKEETIKAFPKSPGILCFMYKKDAETFIRDECLKNAKIIKVRGIGEPNLKPLLIDSCGFKPHKLGGYYFNKINYIPRLLYTHLSIVAFPAVEVLE